LGWRHFCSRYSVSYYCRYKSESEEQILFLEVMPRSVRHETATATLEHPSDAQRGRWEAIPAAGFLVALILLLVASPVVKDYRHGDLIETGLMTIVMLTAIIAVGSHRFVVGLACLLIMPAILGKWINHFWPDRCPVTVFLAPGLAFLGIVIVCLLGSILRARRVDAAVLCTGISIYLLLGLFWMFAYLLVNQFVPAAFAMNGSPVPAPKMTDFDACYFSFITLATVGYGDITPVASVARMLAMTEAMTGTLFLGVLIARLVSLYSTAGAASG
jgi:hypothetical protein